MPEIYKLALQGSGLTFAACDEQIPQYVLEPDFGANGDRDIQIVCCLGDTDLLQCVVYRRDDVPGGIFALHDANGLLFIAIAPNNLIYAMAMGFFGEMVANARYGVDIFEDMEEQDD